jgi:uncharacterized protein YjbJ (UPF0337 family)
MSRHANAPVRSSSKNRPNSGLPDPGLTAHRGDRRPTRVFKREFWNTMGASPLLPQTKEVKMDWNRVEGNWKQVKGAVKQQWGKLTDDDMTQINGSREKLEGIIQERYGIARDETRKQIDSWYQNQNWH